MLKVSSERKCFTFELDGKQCEVPLSPSYTDIKRAGMVKQDASEEDALSWFITYISKYVKGAADLPLVVVAQIMQEWTKSQQEQGEASLGE